MNYTNTGHSGSDYYLLGRSDVAELIPYHCKNILEIGCGYGALGRALVERQNCGIDGVEINPDAEPYLRGIYRRYWIGDIERIQIDQEQKYDCILLPDVLEHLIDPWVTLTRLGTLLTEEGIVVASIPNVRNLGILYRLLVKGRWEYKESGLLDRGHLRFFTRTEIFHLFTKCGFEIGTLEVNRDRYPGFIGLVARIACFFIPDIDVCQYRIRARKAARA
jgi:2-polyprenyl-3-methyl-5-hydroxy-6-metoxy-1,4-benzoquinol methylase